MQPEPFDWQAALLVLFVFWVLYKLAKGKPVKAGEPNGIYQYRKSREGNWSREDAVRHADPKGGYGYPSKKAIVRALPNGKPPVHIQGLDITPMYRRSKYQDRKPWAYHVNNAPDVGDKYDPKVPGWLERLMGF